MLPIGMLGNNYNLLHTAIFWGGVVNNNTTIINNYFGCCPQPQIPPQIIMQLIMILIQLLQAQQGGCGFYPPIFGGPGIGGPIGFPPVGGPIGFHQ
jgi:hypothetical protein